MKNFKELIVWQNGMDIVTQCYKLVEYLPANEQFNFRNQMTRSSLSIPSNIAEGSSRSTQKGYKRFLTIALGSIFELETQIIAAVNVGLLNTKKAEPILGLIEEEQKMLQSFIKTIS
ncbi:four helix bundle protein [Fodinibius salsisoli]|uniref:Four helix bundle protein n=1 Tax=Fodinibius salsisoli TaxID=2820877 RepID=A0ABT3PMC3_9BACT|nr:four helix bundle protein [Fodinibius salsisoli]MCW9706918.1 four helix bundle protein [Fodinibius salsisoli]